MDKQDRNVPMKHTRRTILSGVGLAVGVGTQFVLAGRATAAEDAKPMLMFVQISDDLKVDPEAKTLRLVNVGQQTLYFSDRPVRLAGHVKMADYLEEWTKKAASVVRVICSPQTTAHQQLGRPGYQCRLVKCVAPRSDVGKLLRIHWSSGARPY